MVKELMEGINGGNICNIFNKDNFFKKGDKTGMWGDWTEQEPNFLAQTLCIYSEH